MDEYIDKLFENTEGKFRITPGYRPNSPNSKPENMNDFTNNRLIYDNNNENIQVKPKIFIFSWNTQSIDYSDNSSDIHMHQEFCDKLKLIIPLKTDIIVIALQEETAKSGLISNRDGLFNKTLKTIGFNQIEYIDMLGWGVTTYKKLFREFKYEPRGLSLAVYIREDAEFVKISSSEHENPFSYIQTSSMTYTCPSIIQRITKSKGGVAICLNIPTIGRILFLNVHLPFDSNSIKQHGKNSVRPKRTRSNAFTWQVTCLKYLYHTAMKDFDPEYYFLMGDLNFRVMLSEFDSEKMLHDLGNNEYCTYLDHDELRMLMSYDFEETNGFIMKEGVEDSGPQFYPTAKLQKGRLNIDGSIPTYRIGLDSFRIPSWTDRILYQDLREFEKVVEYSLEIDEPRLECVTYDRFDVGTMNLSDHAAVYSVFDIIR